MSTVIAYTADALLVPSSVEVVAPDTARAMPVRMPVGLERKGVLTRVNCPGDAATAEHEVPITSLQDVQTLEEALCTMPS